MLQEVLCICLLESQDQRSQISGSKTAGILPLTCLFVEVAPWGDRDRANGLGSAVRLNLVQPNSNSDSSLERSNLQFGWFRRGFGLFRFRGHRSHPFGDEKEPALRYSPAAMGKGQA
jgi:hypothetical protein